jgi:hypothetical protein
MDAPRDDKGAQEDGTNFPLMIFLTFLKLGCYSFGGPARLRRYPDQFYQEYRSRSAPRFLSIGGAAENGNGNVLILAHDLLTQ